MAFTQGSKYIFGSPATLALYDSTGGLVVTAYVSPDMESYDISHEADTDEVRNSEGEVVGHIGYNNRLTLTVNFIPANTTSVANALRLLSLDGELQGFVAKGLLSVGHAKVLLGVEDAAQRSLVARRVIEEGLSVRGTEKLALPNIMCTWPLMRSALARAPSL